GWGKAVEVLAVVGAGQGAGPASQADRESAVRWHAVGKGFKVAGVAGGVFAPCADRGEVVGVTVQPLPAGDEFQTAEEQVEAVGPAPVARLREGVEGAFGHGGALDGGEVGAVRCGRRSAQRAVVSDGAAQI